MMRSFVLVRWAMTRFELVLAEIPARCHVGVAVPPYDDTKVISSVQVLYGGFFRSHRTVSSRHDLNLIEYEFSDFEVSID
jgi:hypothetical protein